jgi:hypothetical protein
MTCRLFKLIFIQIGIALLVFGVVLSGCGKKGPPEMIEKSQEIIKPVENLKYQVSNNNILLSWESNYKTAINGFEMFMAKQDIEKCKGCPVVFIKIDFLSPDVNEYQKDLKKGYRYFFKIVTTVRDNIKSKDSETIKIEFQ